jgi:hypothetical protein
MDLAALRRWWPLAAVVGLLCAAALAATRSTPQLERIPPGADVVPTVEPRLPGEIPPSAAGEPPPAVGGGLPESAGTVALIVLGALIAVLLVVVGWSVARDLMRRRGARTVRRRAPVPAVRTAEDLVAALDAGLLDLDDADLDPRRAVIACWVRLEQAAADAGTSRHPGDTPTDLVARLLAEQRVDASVLAAFAEVYREARYATHTVDDRMRAGAREALQRLRADLADEVRAGAER